ncbi:hypothetical protein V2J09_003207 [Rumex salicifolius]
MNSSRLVSDKLKSMESDDTDVAERDPSGRYIRFNEILGKGACKTVYKAFDEIDGIEVAWNQVRIDDVVQSQERLEMLYSEVHLLKTLKHDHIIKYYFSWVDDVNRTVNIITELFTSGSLRRYRKKHKKVDLKAIKNWARQVLRGLLYLHSHSPPIIHRDLKCDNIFINGNTGQVKIGDLGLAVVMHQPTVRTVIGTPEFMAPELYAEEYNELVDVYSFGMCIMEMVTCEYPYYECQNPAQIYKKVTSGIKPASLGKVTDPQLKQFIERCILPASLRSSVAELLKDPFLAPDTSGKVPCVSLPSSNNPPELQSHLMDIDIDGKNSCCTSSECSYKSPPATIQVSNSNPANSFNLSGKEEGDESICMTLIMGDNYGHMKYIHFIYYLQNDTTLSIAGEMVDELNLPNEDAVLIADLMDDLIRKIELRRSSNQSSNVAVGVKALPECMEFPNAGDSSFSKVSAGLTCANGIASYKGFNSGTSDGVSTSNISLLTLDDDDKCEELETELAVIHSEYDRLAAELEKRKTEAIECAKRKWVAKKMPFN